MNALTGPASGNGVVIDASGLFQKLAALQHDARPEIYLRAIGLRIMSWIDGNFKSSGAGVGGWPPLSPNTVAGRRQGSSAPLQDTGRLKQSWTRASGNPHVMGDQVSITSNIKYANYHQFGTGPYIIKPKKAGGRLAFMTAGGMRFAGIVHHPGLPKRQMTPPVEVARELARSTLQAAVDKAAAQANKGSASA